MKSKAFKLVVGTLIILGVLFLALVVLVRFFFPSEVVRTELQAVLSEQLKGAVTIQSLEFDVLRGLQVQQVNVLKQDKPLAHLDGLTLRYNLWHLLHGELVVNELVLNRADVSVNLAELEPEARDEVPAPAVPEPGPPTRLPAIPVMLDLQALAVRDSSFRVYRGEDFAAGLRGVNLHAALSAGPRSADLSGNLHVTDAELLLQKKKLQLPLALDFALSVDLPTETLDVQRFTLRSDPAIRLALSGQVQEFLTNKVAEVSVTDFVIDLESVSRLAADFLPPETAGARIGGRVSPTFRAQGALLESGFEGVVRAEVQGVDVHGSFPPLGAILEAATFTLQTSDIPIKANTPGPVGVELALQIVGVEARSYRARAVNLNLIATYSGVGKVSGNVRLKGEAFTPPFASVGRIHQPFEVQLAGSGDINDLAVSIERARVKVGSLVAATVRAGLSPTPGSGGPKDLSLTAEVQPQLAHLIALVPKDQLSGLTLRKQDGQDVLKVEVKGKLGSRFEPQDMDVSANIQLGGLATSMPVVGAEGKLEALDLSIRGRYGAKNGRMNGKVDGSVALANLKYGAMAGASRATVKLGSTFTGAVSPDLQLTELISQDTVTLSIDGVQYRDPTVAAQLKGLVVSTQSQVDLLGGAYRLESLRASLGSIFELTAKGAYRTKEQRFALEASLPSLNLGELLKQVSGKAVQPVTEMRPKGLVSVRVSASGVVPGSKKLDLLTLPVAMSCQLEVKDVQGAFQGNEVAGANGTVALSFEPKDQKRLKASTHVKIDSVQLSLDLPVQQVSSVFADVELTAEQFDQLHLQEFRAGLKGGQVSLDGSVTGVRPLLEEQGTQVPQHVGPLFVKLRSRAAVELDELRDLLQSYGIEGTGRAEVALSVLKKERGPIDVQLRLDPRSMTITKKPHRFVNMSGALSIRKVLDWIPGQDGATAVPPLRPSAILPELRGYSSQQRELKLERVDLGFLTLSNLSGWLEFDRNRLLVQNLAMNLLNGGLGGTLELASGTAFGAKTTLEFAQLDLNDLLDTARKVQRDSLIDGILRLAVFFDAEQGNVDLGRTEMNLSITRIGRDALNRLLLFLDPQGSNPSIVGARSSVGLANPSEVRVTLYKGMMGLRIEFQEGLLSSFAMERIPVGKITFVRNVTQAIPQWETIRQAMRLLGADRYGVDREGNIILQ